MPETAIVILAKAPERGRVKTRLAATIGEDAALSVYQALLDRTAAAVAQWPGPVLLAAGGDDAAWHECALAAHPRRPQAAGGLGTRIANALRWGLAEAEAVIAIGSDCPGLQALHLHDMATLLSHHPLAFGPADDGGYWGIGVSTAAIISLVCDDNLPWSTPHLLQETTQRVQAAGHSYGLGPTLSDCDTIADLRQAQRQGHLTWPAQQGVA